MKILFIATREIGYPRNQMMLRILQSLGDVKLIGSQNRGSLVLRSIKYALQTLSIVLQKPYDLVVVGFYGQLMMLPIGLVKDVPILFDAFLSTYDTLCFDRKVFSPQSLGGRLAYLVDRISCAVATQVLLDTQAQKAYFEMTFGIPGRKIESVFVGCDERVFFPCPDVSIEPVILFYGSYMPLHGVDIIVRAARLIRDDLPIHIHLIGEGPAFNAVRQLAKELEATNVDFLPPVPLEALPDQISRAMICLGGHFGASEKAGRVIPGKTFQCLAMARPVIVGDNLANRELLTHGEDAWFCRMNDPEALAGAIKTLYLEPNLRLKIANGGYTAFLEKASYPVLQNKIQKIVLKITTKV